VNAPLPCSWSANEEHREKEKRPRICEALKSAICLGDSTIALCCVF
jgi:hypothetical protein